MKPYEQDPQIGFKSQAGQPQQQDQQTPSTPAQPETQETSTRQSETQEEEKARGKHLQNDNEVPQQPNTPGISTSSNGMTPR